jgi:predicted small secreted protein
MSERIVKLTLASFVLAVLGLALTGCNAVEGAGKDLQEASQNTKEALSN